MIDDILFERDHNEKIEISTTKKENVKSFCQIVSDGLTYAQIGILPMAQENIKSNTKGKPILYLLFIFFNAFGLIEVEKSYRTQKSLYTPRCTTRFQHTVLI